MADGIVDDMWRPEVIVAFLSGGCGRERGVQARAVTNQTFWTEDIDAKAFFRRIGQSDTDDEEFSHEVCPSQGCLHTGEPCDAQYLYYSGVIDLLKAKLQRDVGTSEALIVCEGGCA